MKVTNTPLKDLLIIEPVVFADSRGFFFESYNYQKLEQAGITIKFFQDNQSRSCRGVVRGLHYQKGNTAQTKLVRCLQGSILDVAVDLRQSSPTFGQHYALELSAENKKQLLVPQGFAHGFSVLSETAEVLYKCDNYYSPANERGIIWNDPQLNIEWQINNPEISAKDQLLPFLKDIGPQDLFI